jgi:uncharacterized membrane protein
MSVNPFDLKTVLLAKHAQHVVLIHFPIALFTVAVAVVFDFLAPWKFALEGQKLKGILLMHLVLGCTSAVVIWVVFLIHLRARRNPQKSLPAYRLSLEAIAVLLVGVTAHLGGFLSGVNGPG